MWKMVNKFLESKGVSAHGMEPKNGKNAGLYLAEFLSKQSGSTATHYFHFVSTYFFEDSRGTKTWSCLFR